METVILNLNEGIELDFDETVVAIDAWYDRHTRLWIIQKLNKDGYQIGDAEYVYGKSMAMLKKKEYEGEIER